MLSSFLTRFVYGEKGPSLYASEFQLERAEEDVDDAVSGALADLDIDASVPELPPPRVGSPTSFAPSGKSSTSTGRRFSMRRPTLSPEEEHEEMQEQTVDLSLVFVPRRNVDGFRPVAGFKIPASRKSCLAMSDIGFLAASAESSLLLVDMRGPEVLLYETPANAAEGEKKKGRRTDFSAITSLAWTISTLGDGEPLFHFRNQPLAFHLLLMASSSRRADHERTPRLIVVQESGLTRIFDLSQVAGTWVLRQKVTSVQRDTVAGAFSSFVIDKLGVPALANPGHLQRALAHQNAFDDLEAKGALTAIWVTVAPNAVGVYFNVDGPRTAVHEGSGFVAAQVVVRFGVPVLVVVGKSRNITVLSLPDLSQVTRMTFSAEVQ